ncbi:MAG: type IV secretion system protein, partial [Alphaproteobacteria bacterium]|nr:type IV secretion system protein [Alphaproteobacteria bacterium]
LNIFPLHRVQTFFIQTEDVSGKDVYVQPFEGAIDEASREKLTTSLVRQYVLERERFSTDYRFIENMWGQESTLRYMSSRNTYQDMIQSSLYKKVFVLGNPKRISRFVEIKSILHHKRLDEWEVEGRVVDYQEGATSKQVQTLKVILQIEFSANTQKMTYKNQFKNPFGFVVKGYKYLRQPSY